MYQIGFINKDFPSTAKNHLHQVNACSRLIHPAALAIANYSPHIPQTLFYLKNILAEYMTTQ